METKEIKKLDQLNSVDVFFFWVARTLGLNDLAIKSITRNQSSKLGFLFLSIFLAWVVGNYTSHAVFTVLLLFLALIYKTAIQFENSDYDDLLSQYKATQKGEENSNQWRFQKMKSRLKWYGLFFMIMFIISLWQTQMANIAFTLNVVLALLFGCAVATVVATALSEYTLGGLHRNRKLHFVLIGVLVAYSFARYIFDYIG
jgi:hypothetical protein